MANERWLIDADRARETATIDLIVHHIDRQPTVDAAEVVRCAECKFRTYDNYHEIYYCANVRGLRAPLSMTNFCSYGEKSGTQPQREDV